MRTITAEKRVTILSAEALAELGRLGVGIDEGSGRIYARLSFEESVAKPVLRLLKHEGFTVKETD